MIFVGAYLPFMIVGLRARFVNKRRELQEKVAVYERDSHAATESSQPPADPTTGV